MSSVGAVMDDELHDRTRRFLIYGATILVSMLAHWALVGGLSSMARKAPKKPRVMEMAVVRPPPQVIEVAPIPISDPVKEETKRPPPPKSAERKPPPPQQTPPPNTAEPPAAEPAKPVFGISMSSTVAGNSGFSVRVGNTTMKDPEKEKTAPHDVKPLGGTAEKYVPVYALASPPKALGECREPYPAEARAAHVQGRIKLDVEIRADGTVGDVTPLNKLGYGLEETAVRALKKCRFKPGSDGTSAVATRITYLYTFNYEDG